MSSEHSEALVVRLGGLGMLLTFTIFFFIKLALNTDLPPLDASAAEVAAYISEQTGARALANGLRNLALFSLPFFAVGMYIVTGRGSKITGNPWGLVGLVGAAALTAMGMVTNNIQAAAFMNIDDLSSQPEHFRLLWNVVRVLFTAVVMLWGLVIGSFSIAGWVSATMPRWMSGLGMVAAAGGLLTALGIFSVMAGGWAAYVGIVAGPLCLLWFLCSGILLVRRASG